MKTNLIVLEDKDLKNIKGGIEPRPVVPPPSYNP